MGKTLKEKQEQFLSLMMPVQKAEDRSKLLRYIKEGENVLLITNGNIQTAKLIVNKFDKVKILILDTTKRGEEKALEFIEYYSDRVKFKNVSFLNFLPVDNFDVVIFDTSLHEMYSSLEYENKKFNIDIIPVIIRKACKILRDNGRIIVRDSIANSSNYKITVQFKDKNLEKLAKIYIRNCAWGPLDVRETSVGYVMSYNSMVELLYAITWGEEELIRELKKQRCFFSLKDWERLAFYTNKYYGVNLREAFEYTQKEYVENLDGKVKVFSSIPENPSRKVIPFPSSNAIIVLQKNI